MTTNAPVNFGDRAKKNMTDKLDEDMLKSNMVPEVDAQGKRTGAYVKYRTKEETVTKTTSTPKSRQTVPVMQADQTKKTGQKQIGKRVWDDEKKQWKMI